MNKHYFTSTKIAKHMQIVEETIMDMFLPEDLTSSDKKVASEAWYRVLSHGRRDRAILQAWCLLHEYNVLAASGKMDSWSKEDRDWALRGHAFYAAEYLNHLTTYSDDLMAVGAAKAIADALAAKGVDIMEAA